MSSNATRPAPFLYENRHASSPIQVLQVHLTAIPDDYDDYLPAGLYLCHAPLIQAMRRISAECKQLDVVIADSEFSVSEIMAIRKVTNENNLPLVLHTATYDWKTKEIAIECHADEYHIGSLDERFAKRVKLIKKIRATQGNPGRKLLHQHEDAAPGSKFWIVKRSLDVIASLLIIAFLLPALLIIVPLLMIGSHGSILSSSRRVGRYCKVFDLYNFSFLSPDGSRKKTGIESFLCKLHLAQLPQIINVLKGDLSFVGNFPLPEEAAKKLTKDGLAWRFLAPAGIVGLWRLKYQGNPETGDCLEEDIEYAKSGTLLLDFRILRFHLMSILDVKHREWTMQHSTSEHNTPLHVTAH